MGSIEMFERHEALDAPKTLRACLLQEEDRLCSHGIDCDLLIPSNPTDTSKAVLRFNAGIVVAHICIWSTGMIEFIVMSVGKRKELLVRDLETSPGDDLSRALVHMVDKLIELVSIERED